MTDSNVSSAERLSRLQAQMAHDGVDLVAIAPTANMRYLLGFAPLADERPCALLVSRQATRFVVPMLNADQVEGRTGLKAIRWADAAGPQQALAEALSGLGVAPGGVLAADDTMRADALLILQEAIRPARTLAAGGLMTALRIRKSEAEIEALARAAAQADRAVMVGVEACRPGVTEREVADKIAGYFRQDGAELVDFTIVASGPSGAFPHHETGDRRLQPGDTIIIDIGASLHGYKSDVTRVVHLGEPSDEVRAVYQAVLEANRRGREAARAGARARDVDRAARGSIEQAGYGPHFLHRTGHGLGLEVHEPPWMTSESDTLLEPGMVFSVEPGVYLQGKFGVRIEDIVVVTEGECRCLTGLDHQLMVKA
ncbi:MAG: aminopeptidase P family protein [Chloroflexi bacterium]|nr:aminopeptidase P family protein [Chloroflexota bacterium]